MSAVNKFMSAFITGNPVTRKELIKAVSKLNISDPRIVNLLETIDLNDVKLDKKIKSNNIYFVCQHLNAFQDFVA